MRWTRNHIVAVWILSLFPSPSAAQRKVLLTSDSGWATAQIRAQYNALKAANYDVRFPLEHIAELLYLI